MVIKLTATGNSKLGAGERPCKSLRLEHVLGETARTDFIRLVE